LIVWAVAGSCRTPTASVGDANTWALQSINQPIRWGEIQLCGRINEAPRFWYARSPALILQIDVKASWGVRRLTLSDCQSVKLKNLLQELPDSLVSCSSGGRIVAGVHAMGYASIGVGEGQPRVGVYEKSLLPLFDVAVAGALEIRLQCRRLRT
jgi:hypothetical protein